MSNLVVVGSAGFFASMVDGALGMGFGPTSSTILLSSGVSPAAASASVNLAKVATGLAAGVSHWRFENIDRRLVLRLAIPGACGAGIGATVLANVDGTTLRPYLAVLLISVGLRILVRFSRPLPRSKVLEDDDDPRAHLDVPGVEVAATAGGITNGLVGAWGPVVTPYLLHRGVPPRFSIGCVNTAEIAVALVASGTLIGTEGVERGVVLAMLVGGVVASPLAAYVVRFIPPRLLGLAVSGLLLLTQSRELANTDKLPFDRWFAYARRDGGGRHRGPPPPDPPSVGPVAPSVVSRSRLGRAVLRVVVGGAVGPDGGRRRARELVAGRLDRLVRVRRGLVAVGPREVAADQTADLVFEVTRVSRIGLLRSPQGPWAEHAPRRLRSSVGLPTSPCGIGHVCVPGELRPAAPERDHEPAMTTHDRPFGRHFEDFVVGDVYKHWPGKTITEYDDHLFCMITMNHHPLHTNAWFAENETVQGKNVVVGNLVYSLVLGMSVPDVSGAAIANLEIESLLHPKPTFHGDTIYAVTKVLDVKETSKGDRGIVTVETKGINQRGEEVCYFRRKLMVWKRANAPQRAFPYDDGVFTDGG